MAESAHDNATAGKLDFNISSLYSHLGHIDAATEAVGRALLRLSGPERTAQLPKLLIHLASLQADQERLPQALDLYRQAIAAASRSGEPEIYAAAWNDLGYVYLEHKHFSQAGHALLEAYRVRKLNHLRSIESSYENLGMLHSAQNDNRAASVLLDRAVALSSEPGGLRPNWEVLYARGRVRLAQNRLPDALADLRIAAHLAANWRRQAFPDDATRVSTENKIQKVHAALLDAGNRLYFITHRPDLARETFESAEANRAASLREMLAEPRDWRANLPPQYWNTLREFETVEVASLTPAARSSAVGERSRRLRVELSEMESRAGSNTNTDLPDLLERTRSLLPSDAAFFAFHLDSPDSYLWALSRDRFALYRLPPGPQIAARVARFNVALRQGSTASMRPAGAQIFQLLFGQVDPQLRSRQKWLLALDAQLFELPFAALIENTRAPVFLAESHSLLITTGAGSLSARPQRQSSDGRFVGVADPVYNTADSRWGKHLLFTPSAGGHLQLARLTGSALEVAGCADAWRGPSPPTLLVGEAVCRRSLQAALRSHPAVLHLATHVIDSKIVLSLMQGGQFEVLSPLEIATWNLNGVLVALSGCGSGAAGVLPASGLMGLTRACQLAGAKAVVASRWPTPDDAGALFLSFYQHLRAAPEAGPAAALQQAQIDMLRSRTWRSNPRYWGAYFVSGNQP